MSGAATGLLPEGFPRLERYVADWALGTDAQRAARRHAADFADTRAFYADMLEDMDVVLAYLASHPIDTADQRVRRLLWLSLSFCEIATAVELYRQPGVIDGFDPARFPRVDVARMTPSDL